MEGLHDASSGEDLGRDPGHGDRDGGRAAGGAARARSTRCRTPSRRTSPRPRSSPEPRRPAPTTGRAGRAPPTRDPVVLVHGLFANMTDNWQTMSPLLANNGYCVFALTYGVTPGASSPLDQIGGLAPMEQSAAELSAFVDRVLAATGAHKVDIVGHSEGATMPDYYIEYLGGAAKVARYVGVSGVKHGTTLHGIGTFVSRRSTRSSPARPTRPPRVVRLVPGVPRRVGLHQRDRGAGAGARRHLHEHLDPLRRARQPVHEQLPQPDRTSRTSRCRTTARSTSAITSRSSRARSPASTS